MIGMSVGKIRLLGTSFGIATALTLSGCNFHNAGTVSGPTPEQGWSIDLGPQGEPPLAQPEDPDEA